MKKYINRNYFWASLFVKQLEVLGIKDVCISPGSRNTPLTLAFAANKKIKKHIHVDERSAAFFALGLAKQTDKAVAIVTTSGTAVTELYPAITEAYLQRIPLIVCTADRPAYLKNTGANQTINQENIFKNHIRKFYGTGLPSIAKSKLHSFCKKIVATVSVATVEDKGPVHINFPFEKPLEPDSFTDDITLNLNEFLLRKNIGEKTNGKNLTKVISEIIKHKRIIIHLAWGNFESDFYKTLIRFSEENNIPVFTDGTSGLRFLSNSVNVIVNHSSFLKSERIRKKLKPDLIMQFGNAPTSQTVLKYFEDESSKIISVNEFGDKKNASGRKCKTLKAKPVRLLRELAEQKEKIRIDDKWFAFITLLDTGTEKIKNVMLNKSVLTFEPVIVNNLPETIPSQSNLFISNSTPVRDFDFFASKNYKRINIFTNRGASGIDGIISTASGIAAKSKVKTFLVIGDLAFYHNLNALASLTESKIPLIILLINNNGGGIFNMLPVASSDTKNFEKYFITPQNLNYSKIVKAFGGKYFFVKNISQLKQKINIACKLNSFSVIEIKTDSKKSLQLRKKYWTKVKQTVEKYDN